MLHENSTKDESLKIENLTLEYNNQKILENISISIKKGSVTTILGPNGGGKTSLVKAIVGINKKYTGNIVFADNIKVSYMPQSFDINSLMPITVEYFLLNSSLKKVNQPTFEKVVKLVGIENILQHQVLEISAGQTQLMLLARCLIMESNFIVLDEPVSSMDVHARARFYNIISEIVRERFISVLMTSHDLKSVLQISDYVACIKNSCYFQGKPNEITELAL